MIYKFKSKSCSDVVMLKPHARRLLHILEKMDINDPEDSAGIILKDQIGVALAALQFAIDAEEASLKSIKNQVKDQDDLMQVAAPISLKQRAYPIIEMLKRSQRQGHDVIWEV